MISFGNTASSHGGLFPFNTACKKEGELLWAIASKKNFINLHFQLLLLQFSHVIRSMPTNVTEFKKLLDKFFYKLDNLKIN